LPGSHVVRPRAAPSMADRPANGRRTGIMTDAPDGAYRTTTERPEPAMKLVLASYGVRGDVEPAVVVERELLRGGHAVCLAVRRNLVGFAEAAGLEAVACGLDSKAILDLQRKYFTCYSRTPWKLKELNRMGHETGEFAIQCWEEMTTTLTSV